MKKQYWSITGVFIALFIAVPFLLKGNEREAHVLAGKFDIAALVTEAAAILTSDTTNPKFLQYIASIDGLLNGTDIVWSALQSETVPQFSVIRSACRTYFTMRDLDQYRYSFATAGRNMWRDKGDTSHAKQVFLTRLCIYEALKLFAHYRLGVDKQGILMSALNPKQKSKYLLVMALGKIGELLSRKQRYDFSTGMIDHPEPLLKYCNDTTATLLLAAGLVGLYYW